LFCERNDLNTHSFLRVVALNDQADLLADRSETNKVTHLRRASDREIISLQDDVALADTRALGRGARANLLDASALEVTAGGRVQILQYHADTAALDVARRDDGPSPSLPC
jgi:hypothetical protein